jgi:hypothetical protein
MASQNGTNWNPDYHIHTGEDLTAIVAAPSVYTFVSPSQWSIALPAKRYTQMMAEPFNGDTIGSETTAFLTLAADNATPSPTLFVYEGWPTQTNYGSNYQTYFLASGSWPTTQQLTMQQGAITAVYTAVAAQYGLSRVFVAPAGTVFASVDAAARAGNIPGASTVADFYRDDQHMGQAGQFVAACTIYSTLFRQQCPSNSHVVSYFTAGGSLPGLALDVPTAQILAPIVWSAVMSDSRAFH